MNKIKLIALDLDGTLLNDKKEVSERNREALRAAHEKGAEIVFSTGRYYDMIPDAAKELDFVNYGIFINGAEVYDIKNKKVLSEKIMDLDTCLEALEYIATLDVIYDAYVENKGYMSKDIFAKIYDERYLRSVYHRENIEQFRTVVPDLFEFLKEKGKGLQKFQFFSQDRDKIKRGTEYIRAHYPQFTVSSSLMFNTEINGEGVNKGNALKILAEKLGIDMSETMAFGDGGNDMVLLKAAGMGVAMDNGMSEVKSIADYVTLSNNEDGVAYAIEKFLL